MDSTSSTSSARFIVASGPLAKHIDPNYQDGSQPLKLGYKGENANVTELSRWKGILADLKPTYGKLYFQCGRCAEDVQIKNCRGKDYVAHCSNTAARNGQDTVRCEWMSERNLEKLIEIGSLEEEFHIPFRPNRKVRLRLKKAVRGILPKPAKDVSGVVVDYTEPRSRSSGRSLFGVAVLLSEASGVNRMWNERTYARSFVEVMPWIAQLVRSDTGMSFLGELAAKFVFPETQGKDFRQAVEAAVEAPCSTSCVKGRAVVMGRLWQLVDRDSSVEVTLTGMGSERLYFKEESLLPCRTDSFGEPLLPGEKDGLETMFIAVVEPDGTKLKIVEAAWGFMNSDGLLSTNKFAYEMDAAAQLTALKVPFLKGLQQRVRVGKWALIVDFIVRLRVAATGETKWVVLEVDPNGSAERKRDKIERIQRCLDARVHALSHDPSRMETLRDVIESHGFMIF